MRRAFFVALIGVVWLFGVTQPAAAGKPRRGGKNVWSGLVMATNAPRPRPAPPEVFRFNQTLQRTFGYNQFELIGVSRKALLNDETNWLATSKHFSLRVDPRGVTRDGYRVNLQLFQDRQLLLETDATLNQSGPLVIRGPQIGAGQLLLLLTVQ